jgi:hypothetical protein
MIALSRALLLTAVALPVISWVLKRFVLQRKVSWLLMVLLTCVGCVVVALSSFYALEAGLWANMMAFDLDRDGSISGAEMTRDAEIAMAEWSSDTGRNFGTVFSIPLFVAWTAVVYCVLSAGDWVVSRCFARGHG